MYSQTWCPWLQHSIWHVFPSASDVGFVGTGPSGCCFLYASCVKFSVIIEDNKISPMDITPNYCTPNYSNTCPLATFPHFWCTVLFVLSFCDLLKYSGSYLYVWTSRLRNNLLGCKGQCIVFEKLTLLVSYSSGKNEELWKVMLNGYKKPFPNFFSVYAFYYSISPKSRILAFPSFLAFRDGPRNQFWPMRHNWGLLVKRQEVLRKSLFS